MPGAAVPARARQWVNGKGGEWYDSHMGAKVRAVPSPAAGPRLTVVDVPVSALTPAPYNPRSITSKRFDQLKRSLSADPDMLRARPLIALPDGTVVCGNMRLRAAQALGWETVPTVYADLDERRAREWMIRDNREWGEDVEQDLAEMLAGLQEAGSALDLLGFPDGDIERLLASVGIGMNGDAPDAQIDRAEELREQWGTATGQIWLIPSKTAPGKAHRLLCGDATCAEDVARLMAGEKAGIIFTDPPYGVGHYESDMRALTPSMLSAWAAQCPTAIFGWPEKLVELCVAARIVPDEWVTWWPTNGAQRGFNTGGLLRESECIAIFGGLDWQSLRVTRSSSSQEMAAIFIIPDKRGRHAVSQTERHCGDVWIDPSPGLAFQHKIRNHPNEKSVHVVKRVLEAAVGDVYDPFIGSGTTMVAAEQLGRICYGMEISPGYVAVALQRMADAGLTPERGD